MVVQGKTTALKIIYTIFLGLIIALFFGLGVAAFYEGPKIPEYPMELEKTTPECVANNSELKAKEEKMIKDQKEYQAKFSEYSRNVSVIVLVLAILTIIVSLLFLDKILILSDGLMLGGVFTLIYSIIRGFMSEDVRYRFIIVSVGLIVTLVLGYIKFIRQEKIIK